MKILVFSDSHGNLQNMVQAVERELPDRLFHLGDYWRDAQSLHARFPAIPFSQVPGNCDLMPNSPAEQLLYMEGKKILLCHGHTYGVKQSLLRAGYAAEEQQLDLFLFGHTHRPFADQREKTLFLNPGSIGDRLHPSYGIVTLDGNSLDVKTVGLT